MILSACSSGKKSGKPGAIGMVYHNITARNNAFFNGNELLKETQRNLKENHKDNYDEIIAIYPDRIPEEAKAQAAALDEIIKKASRAITMHEPSKFSDNSYLLIGMSNYLKADYETALEMLQYLSTEYKDVDKKKSSKKKKKKKKKKKGKKSNKPMTSAQREALKEEKEEAEIEEILEAKEKEEQQWDGKKSLKEYLSHQGSRPAAMVLMVNIYTAMKKYKEAETVLTVIKGEEDFPGYLANEVALAEAELYIIRENYDKAIPPLLKLDENIKRRKKKIRYLYILAQIYERAKDYTNAVDKYKEVLKARPNYEMEFNAKMSLARIAGGDGSSYSEIKKLLTKLLKDGKNKEFFDQVYYALAELELSQNNRSEAIEYLSKSIESSAGNTVQLAKSHLKQGELYYMDREYIKAQPGYENAAANIAEANPKKEEVHFRNETLQKLVEQVNIIEEKDSLLVLVSLSPEELEKELNKVLDEMEAALDDKNKSRQATLLSNNVSSQDAGASSSGSWYFYNSSSRSKGYNDFIQRWGKRNLDDNWRRSNKESLEELEDISAESGIAPEEVISEKDGFDYFAEKEKLMAALPLDEAAQFKMQKEAIEAYFYLGNIYKFDVKDLQKSIETFEALLAKYPDNGYLVEVYYNLHLLYDEIGNKEQAEKYRNLVINDYPNSKFAKILLDPSYLNRQNDAKEKVDRYYENVYAQFHAGNYQQVVYASAQADSLFEFNYLAPKFALLSAMSRANTDSLGSYIDALQQIPKDFPGTSEAEKATEMLEILEGSENKIYEKEINLREYAREKDALHYMLVVYNSNNVKSTDLSLEVNKFNEKMRSLENLKTNTLILNAEQATIVVKYFEGERKAESYLTAIQAEKEFFKEYPAGTLKFYYITDFNFNKVVINKELDSYFEFFEKTYKN